MLSQNGLAKAKLLNMHTKVLIRAFDKGSRRAGQVLAPKGRFARPPGPVHNLPTKWPQGRDDRRKGRLHACRPQIRFHLFARPQGVLVMFCDDNLKFGPATQRALAPLGDLVRRAAAADRFTGKSGASLDIVAPSGLDVPRLVVSGIGKESELKSRDIVKLGGIAMGKVPTAAANATIFAEFGSGALKANMIADLALGARLRAYTFDLYKTKRKEDEERPEQGRAQFRLCQRGIGGEGLGRSTRRSPTASCSPAISSTSRPTCSIRSSSRAAPRLCPSSASTSKCST